MPFVEGRGPRNTAADSSRYASTPHDAIARTPHPDASMLDARPPSRLSHLQIEDENRSWLRRSKQACKKWTLTVEEGRGSRHHFGRSLMSVEISLFLQARSLLVAKKFPV